MKTSTKITFLDDRGEKFFGEGPAQLLRNIEECGSLRGAAGKMFMAYTKALKLLKHTEEALGYPVVSRTTGGKDGGGSVLTPQGKRFLEKYEAYRDECIKENRRMYRNFFPKTGCVIMASGMSVRFGSNKLLADFCGMPMIHKVISNTDKLFDSRVVVTRHREIADICSEYGIEVILHDLPDRNDTVRLGLEALGDVDCCMFCQGDQPLLRRETVCDLLSLWDDNKNCIIRPEHDGNPGSPVIFPSAVFGELISLPKGKGGNHVVVNHPESVITLSIDDRFELLDADSPDELEFLRSIAESSLNPSQ